jgi:hypothetical protein
VSTRSFSICGVLENLAINSAVGIEHLGFTTTILFFLCNITEFSYKISGQFNNCQEWRICDSSDKFASATAVETSKVTFQNPL